MATISKKLHAFVVQSVSNVRSDFVERFGIFKSMYDRTATKEERNRIAKEFLTHCTEDEVVLVRSVIDDVLSNR